MHRLFLWAMLSITLSLQAQSVKDIEKISFTTSTRGFSKQIVVSPSSLQILQEGREGIDSVNVQRKVTKEQWRKVCDALKKVVLADVPSLESPTHNRNADGARHSTLNFTLKNGRLLSHSFDNENPHLALQPLMGVIDSLSKKR